MASQMEAAAKKTDQTFQTDSVYTLEQNLHKVRKELISLIEAFEHKDCSACKQLKCSCTESSPPSARPAEPVEPASSVDFSTVAPSANVLPKPMWENGDSETSKPEQDPKDVESWVRASTPSAQLTLPKVKAADWADKRSDVVTSFPCFPFKSTDKKSSADAAATMTSISDILNKASYDFKGGSNPPCTGPALKPTPFTPARSASRLSAATNPLPKPAPKPSRA